MHILFLTQWFDPEPMPRGLAFAKSLRDAGHSVEVITGFPNYPGGKLYPGYKLQWRQREIMDGITVNRVPLYPSHDHNALKRILNYGSFAFFSCLYGLFFAKKADVMYVYHPPITTAVSAAIISFFRRTPFVLDIQDMWPDTLRATGMLTSPKLLNIIDALSRWSYRRAAHITVLSPGFRRLLIERNIDAAKIDVVYNWCDDKLVAHDGVNKYQLEMDNRFNIVFAGTMGKAQALHSVLSAAKQVEQINPNIQFIFVGSGIEVASLKDSAQAQQLKNVLFLPRMPMNEVGRVLHAADLLLVHLKNDPLFEITIPSKTQAYFSMGKPILMAVKGDASHLVQAANAGFCISPEDPQAMASSILTIAALPLHTLKEMGANAKHFYMEHLSLVKGTVTFEAIFKKLQFDKQ